MGRSISPLGLLLNLLRRPIVYRRIVRSLDRVLLVTEILPVFSRQASDLLWVGVRRYTRRYPAILERHGSRCWTVDISPRSGRWGRRGRHVVADLLTIAERFPPQAFSAVLCNGVFGYGLDDPASQGAAFQAMAQVLKPGGWLLLGWNTDRTADPLQGDAWKHGFDHVSLEMLPARREISGTTHVYDVLRRKGLAGQAKPIGPGLS
jgi:SAM-dependent methyltransferase